VQASTIVSVRCPPVSTKQGAISLATGASSVGVPWSSASAKPASRAEPTSVTSLPLAKSRMSACVYSRVTVACVPSTETRLVREAAQAGLIAGTVPMKEPRNAHANAAVPMSRRCCRR